MSIYNTKQRRALLAFLGEHPDELLTARQMGGRAGRETNQPQRRVSKPCTVGGGRKGAPQRKKWVARSVLSVS